MSDPNAVAFKKQVLSLYLQDVHRIEQNNYDYARFSFDGVDRSNLFDVERHAAYLDWFFNNFEQLYVALTRLTDDESRRLLINLIRYRMSGHLHVRIESRVPTLAQEAQRFRTVFAGAPSQQPTAGLFGDLVYYDQEWNGQRYTVDTLKDGLIWTLLYRQYYFDRGGVRIQPEAGDFVIDGGACTGDTTAVFSRSVGPDGRVYSFDPVGSHIEICRRNFERPGYDNVTLFPYGISDRTIEAPPVALAQYDPGWRLNGVVPLARIDDLVIAGRIERLDFLKLDVEGSEMAALRGALSTIVRFKPKLAVSIYHKPNDYFEILNFLHEQNLGYRFYLDHYTIWDEETVLYGIAS